MVLRVNKMGKVLFLLSIMLFSLHIESTENNPVQTALDHGQCIRVGSVIQCSNEQLVVSVKYK